MAQVPAKSSLAFDKDLLTKQWKDKEPVPFEPSPEELAFLQTTTGIKDEQELKDHVVAVQRKAVDVFPYPCILKYMFTQINIQRIAGFKKTIQLAKDRPDALLLDMGCCMGADVRMAVLQGFPPANIIASDLHPQFWELGRELFKDDEASMPIVFVAGDVWNSAFLDPNPPDSPPSHPVLSTLTTLTPLHGRLSSIHASLFFHLFSREEQQQLAHLLASLLLQERGSVMFGHQIGAEEEGLGRQVGKWAHNTESWRRMMQQAFADLGWKGGVDVQAELREAPEFLVSIGMGTHLLYWTVELL